jgi:general secretion pathway protein C
LLAVQIDLQKWLNYSLLALAVLGGIVAGSLSGQTIQLLLGGEAAPLQESLVVRPAARQLQDKDFQVILDRNLFDSKAAGRSERLDLTARQTAATQPASPAQPRGEMQLIGTVVAGEKSLALIRVGRKSGVFRLQDELSPGVVLIEITRQLVILRDRGVRRELLLKKSQQPQAKRIRQGGVAVSGKDVVALGENRWQVSKAAAENARLNLNKLLQTARMIPQVQNGKTIGFKLVEMEKGSLLEQIGLRIGDLVVEINQVELNSPEKALQVFQQVREASNISLGLVRNGQRQTFEYRFE